jgi:cysteine synthase
VVQARVPQSECQHQGIALALGCAQMELKFLSVMPEGVSSERIFIIHSYSGEVKLTSGEDGIRGAIAEVERLGTEPDIFLPRQFADLDNVEAHARLGFPSAQIVTVFPDRMEKYFTTELFEPFV